MTSVKFTVAEILAVEATLPCLRLKSTNQKE